MITIDSYGKIDRYDGHQFYYDYIVTAVIDGLSLDVPIYPGDCETDKQWDQFKAQAYLDGNHARLLGVAKDRTDEDLKGRIAALEAAVTALEKS